MKKILHLASQNCNIGDGALIQSIQDMLKEKRNDLEFINEDKWEYTRYKTKNMDYFYKKANNVDAIIIGGGGMISAHQSCKENGISFPISQNFLQNYKKPIIFYALGDNVFYKEEYPHTK
jgi:polysaccharide pyruvyl transferase WcaK-like protein